MEVGQGPNWGCSAKKKYNNNWQGVEEVTMKWSFAISCKVVGVYTEQVKRLYLKISQAAANFKYKDIQLWS
jgi:hypothetical protein